MSLRENIRTKFPRFYEWLIYLNNTVFYNRFHKKSYAQFGEDMILDQLFPENYKGFFVDVGAHRPTQCSNTYFFYKKGWRGINIDAMPGSMKLFNVVRPGDINIEEAVSDAKQKLTYYSFNRPLQNGFFSNDSLTPKDEGLKIIEKREIITARLDEILKRHLKRNQLIDFLSIDVEGLDFSVLKSNDWTLYKPAVILIEILDFSLEKLDEYQIFHYLKGHGYSFYSRTVHTLIFVHKNFKQRV